MDREGKIRNKLDDSLCLTVGNGIRQVRGGARVKFVSCAANVQFNTFEHDRSSADMIRVKEAPSYCLKQTGNGADRTDTIRTELCDISNPDFLFDYDDSGCDVDLSVDVNCCNDDICNQDQICVNYECEGLLIPPPGYQFLVSQASAEEEWCIAEKEGTEDGKNLGILPCDFEAKLDSQLFRLQSGKINNRADDLQCLTVKTGGNIFTQGAIRGGDRIQFLDCDSSAVFTFAHDETLATDTISLGEDPTFCLTQTGSSAQATDTIRAEPCVAENPSFQFEFRPVT